VSRKFFRDLVFLEYLVKDSLPRRVCAVHIAHFALFDILLARVVIACWVVEAFLLSVVSPVADFGCLVFIILKVVTAQIRKHCVQAVKELLVAVTHIVGALPDPLDVVDHLESVIGLLQLRLQYFF
jgi:hypothetical protein